MARPTGTNIKTRDIAKDTVNSIVSGKPDSKEIYTTTIRIPASLRDRMTDQARMRGLTNSAFIKLAISSLVDEMEKENK